jgi:uncharacterized protein YdeI (YjbR/CyaY-like superfamily)
LQWRLDDNAVLRSAFATLTPGRRKVRHFPRLICEAGKNQSSAGRKVLANDPEWAWVQ